MRHGNADTAGDGMRILEHRRKAIHRARGNARVDQVGKPFARLARAKKPLQNRDEDVPPNHTSGICREGRIGPQFGPAERAAKRPELRIITNGNGILVIREGTGRN
jgi:hypothetical protein